MDRSNLIPASPSANSQSPRPARFASRSVGAADAIAATRVFADSIESLELTELVRLIVAARLPLIERDGLRERLAYYDRGTLDRLAHLARRRHAVVANGGSEYFERPGAPDAGQGAADVR